MFSYPEVTIDADPNARIADEGQEEQAGAGPSLKTNTRDLGLVIREMGSSDPLEEYPYLTVINETFSCYAAEYAENGVPSANYNAWRNTMWNSIKKEFPFTFENQDNSKQQMWDTGIAADIIIALSMWSLGMHSFIQFNAVVGPHFRVGVAPHIPSRQGEPDFGCGRILSKTAMRDELDLLGVTLTGSTFADSGFMNKAIKLWVLSYELNNKRMLRKAGYYGVGNISQEDMYSMVAGTVCHIRARECSHLYLNGQVNLQILAEYLTLQLDRVAGIRPQVEQVIDRYCVELTHMDDPSYLQGFLAPREIPDVEIDEDLYYDFTKQYAYIHSVPEEDLEITPALTHVVMHSFAENEEFEPYENTLFIPWIEYHPYRPAWVFLWINLNSTIYHNGGVTQRAIWDQRLKLWNPDVIGESTLTGFTDMFDVHHEGEQNYVNVFQILHKHVASGPDASVRPHFIGRQVTGEHEMLDTIGIDNSLINCREHGEVNEFLNAGMAMGTWFNTLSRCGRFPYGKYTWWNLREEIFEQSTVDYMNQFIKSGVVKRRNYVPRVWNHLSPSGPGIDRDTDTGTSRDSNSYQSTTQATTQTGSGYIPPEKWDAMSREEQEAVRSSRGQ